MCLVRDNVRAERAAVELVPDGRGAAGAAFIETVQRSGGQVE
jgi:hypothetical protein